MKGGEIYIRPSYEWKGYGLKVIGMYDNGNDDWLLEKNNNGEFAVAYIGINYFKGKINKKNEERRASSGNSDRKRYKTIKKKI